jgi:TetR/AcrR family transcriptional regulator, mexJK operon transcriptional repressor
LEAILSVATEIFLAGGYDAASMSAIAAELGGSKGTLYNYFRSKEELFAAVIQDQCDRKLGLMFDNLGTPDDDLVAGLLMLARRFATVLLADDTIRFSRAIAASAASFPELGRKMYDAGVLRTTRRLAGYLEGQMALARLRPADPHRAAEQFLELTLAGLYRKRLWNVIPSVPAQDIEDNVQAAIETFLAAYRLDASTAPPR